MKYINREVSNQAPTTRVGVLITNLGTPDAPQTGAVRRYLKEFLSDPRIVELPRALWWLVLNGVILNIRPARSAAAYRSVWTERGSPLLMHTQDQAQALQTMLQSRLQTPGKERHSDSLHVHYAMRYGNPSIADVLQQMFDAGVNKLLVMPLYPQYSATTTASTFDAIASDFTQRRWLPDLRFVSHYHDHPAYIAALAESVREYREANGGADKLIFSFHGIPQSCIYDGDPYYSECLQTTQLVAQALGLPEDDFTTTFQSRVGRQEWLRPYTDETMKALPSQGVKSVQVICPGFSADCLETNEEIDIENRGYFMAAGGESYRYIPCLNSSAAHIECLADIVQEQASDWLNRS